MSFQHIFIAPRLAGAPRVYVQALEIFAIPHLREGRFCMRGNRPHQAAAFVYEGFQHFIDSEDRPYGSFEVYQVHAGNSAGKDPGWYWQERRPNLLPSQPAFGPYDSAREAYEEAIGD